MAIYDTIIKELELGTYETCVTLARENTTQVKVFKLMPMIPEGTPQAITYDLPTGFTINASGCRPTIREWCLTKNYIQIHGDYADHYHNEPGAGTKFLIRILNGDIRNIENTGETR